MSSLSTPLRTQRNTQHATMDDNSLILLHELEAQKIELEQQNVELLQLSLQAEAEKEKYIELYDSAPSGYFTLSVEGKILELNLAGAELLGKKPSNLKNSSFGFFVSPNTRSIFNLFIKTILSSHAKESCEVKLDINGDELLDVRLTGIVKAGSENCFITAVDVSERARATLLSFANEELLFQNDVKAKRAAELIIANKELLFQNDEKAKRAIELILINNELSYQSKETEKRSAELILSNELLAFQRDRLQQIASLVPGLVFQYRLRRDGSSCFPYASEAIQSVYRVTPEEVLEDASKVLAILHPDDHDAVVASIQKSAKELSIWRQDYRVQFEDGTILFLNGNSVPQLEADGSVLWHGFISDITERKEKEQKIKLQNEELKKLNTEKDKFFSIIAHDLRGPMGSFMLLTELLAGDNQGFTQNEIKEITVKLSQSARNTFNLLENLLEWSQIGRSQSGFNPERVGLHQIVTESVNLLAEQARRKEIELVDAVTIESEVIADKNMLQSVFRNLITNAIKFTHKGGKVTISAKIAENNQTIVSVRDTGIGMTEEMRNNLFRIDANTKRPGTQGERSTGLGLLLCKEFIEKQGGRMGVESAQGIGSVVSFTLPSSNDSLPKKNEDKKVVPANEKRSAPKNLKILLAEDDEISAQLISIMVKKFSSHIYRAKTGLEAVDIFKQNPGIDLVLMDIQMPGMNGYEATRQIRLLNPKVIILAQTTFAQTGDKEKAIKAGCTDYITKPIQIEIFMGMLQKYIKS